MTEPYHFGVVGGGMTGMYLSRIIAGMGHRVTLIEEMEHLGGLADEWELSCYRASQFYHVLLETDTEHLALLEELKLKEKLQWVKAGTGFYIDGALYSISSMAEFLHFPPLGLRDKIRLLFTVAAALWGRNDDDREMAVEWLNRVSGRKVTDRIWRPLLRAKFGDLHHQVSSAYMKAILKRMAGARNTGSKSEMFGYITGGYRTVIDSFAGALKALGVTLVVGQRICSIEKAGDEFHLLSGDGEMIKVDRVIVTVPPPVVPSLCRGLSEREQSILRGIQYSGIVCPSLLIKKELGNYYITNIADESVPFTGIINMTALAPSSTWGGCSLIYLPRYIPADDPLLSCPDHEIRSLFIPPLQKIYPGVTSGDIQCFQVARAAHVFPVITPGFRSLMLPPVTTVPGLYLVNSAQISDGTHNINETVRTAGNMLRIIMESDRK